MGRWAWGAGVQEAALEIFPTKVTSQANEADGQNCWQTTDSPFASPGPMSFQQPHLLTQPLYPPLPGEQVPHEGQIKRFPMLSVLTPKLAYLSCFPTLSFFFSFSSLSACLFSPFLCLSLPSSLMLSLSMLVQTHKYI